LIHPSPQAHPRLAIGARCGSLEFHGSQCIECHNTMTGDNAVAHETFNFISPAYAIRVGTLNSCNICHADKSPEWALDFVKQR